MIPAQRTSGLLSAALLIAAVCTFQGVQACDPVPGFQFATLAEQAEASSTVIRGQVTSIMESEEFGEFVANVTVARVLKGCAPPDVYIVGFRSSALCGVEPPAVGLDAVFFLCEPDPFDDETYPLIQGLFVGVGYDADEAEATLEELGYTDGQDDDCLDFMFDECLDVDAF